MLPLIMADTLIVLLLVGFGIIAGTFVARSSKQREPLHGGALSETFHHLAASLMAVVTPTVLTGIFILQMGVLQALLIAVLLFGGAIVASVAHATFEKGALDALSTATDSGWTEDDARTSGL